MTDHELEQVTEQEGLNATNRRAVLSVVLDYVNRHPDGTAELVLLVDALGLDEELEEMTVDHPERHRRLADVRAQLEELTVDVGPVG